METWKGVIGFNGYLVSNLGNVKSLKGIDERMLKIRFDSRGYIKATLYSFGIRKIFSVHRLVADAFIPNPLNLETVNHKNGIKTDNSVENLEWCTNKENMSHGWGMGLFKNQIKGTEVHTCRLTEKEVLEIRASNEKQTVLSERYGVAKPTINHIKRNRSWKHI